MICQAKLIAVDGDWRAKAISTCIMNKVGSLEILDRSVFFDAGGNDWLEVNKREVEDKNGKIVVSSTLGNKFVYERQ